MAPMAIYRLFGKHPKQRMFVKIKNKTLLKHKTGLPLKTCAPLELEYSFSNPKHSIPPFMYQNFNLPK